jgi:hypothetical protein
MLRAGAGCIIGYPDIAPRPQQQCRTLDPAIQQYAERRFTLTLALRRPSKFGDSLAAPGQASLVLVEECKIRLNCDTVAAPISTAEQRPVMSRSGIVYYGPKL